MKSAPNSASSDEVMINLIICAIVSTDPFHLGSGSLSDQKIWAPARLRPLDSLWKPASAWAASTMLLER